MQRKLLNTVYWHRLLLIGLLGLFWIGGWAQGGRVSAIEVRGLKNVSQDAVLAAMRLKVGELFAKETLDRDERAIQEMGLFTRVRASIEQSDGGTKVIIDLVENPYIKTVVFKGNTVLTNAQLLEVLRNKEGRVFNMNYIRSDANGLREAYAAKGYVVEVEGYEMPDNQDGVLEITVQELKIGEIRVSGNRKTKNKVLTREIRTQPNDLYHVPSLQRDLTRLYNTDYFETIDLDENPVAPGVVDLTLIVKEKPTGRINLGFAIDSRQRLIGLMELHETNFRGVGQTIGVNFQSVGGAEGGSIELTFVEPWLDKKRTSLSVSLYNKLLYRFTSNFFGGSVDQNLEQRYDERRKGITLNLGRPLTDTINAAIGLRAEDVSTNRVATTNQTGFIRQDGSIISIPLRGSLNTRDFDLDPAVGQYYTIAIEPGVSNIRSVDPQFANIVKTGQSNFLRASVDLRYYLSPQGRRIKPDDRRHVFAFRLFYGTVSGSVPFFEQFFVGGAESLRGYQEDRFWGKNSLIFSAEYRVPVAKAFTAVLFADIGDAWGGYPTVNQFSQHNGFKPSIGFGIGVRVRTPLGPLRIDYGIGKDGGRTHFSVGQVF